jgi:N-acetylglucosaminyldiphosphoundecaprenol N-acetyl-beta-D-mannosaminyltransferase
MNITILGVKVAQTNYASATTQIRNWALAGESRGVIATGVHGVMEAYDSPTFKKILNSADMITPDGMPLVWMLRLKGVKNQTRVYGPTLMLHVLEMAAREKIPVGFYGATDQTLQKLIIRLRELFPGLQVAYAFSPPFRSLDEQESAKISQEIADSGARILFVGLGCPKQEKWMAEQKGEIPAVMLGVGAAFDFLAGTKPKAPTWMQSIGFEWLFRLIHEPRRLAKRYLYNNPRFIVLALADLLGILDRGKKEA